MVVYMVVQSECIVSAIYTNTTILHYIYTILYYTIHHYYTIYTSIYYTIMYTIHFNTLYTIHYTLYTIYYTYIGELGVNPPPYR